MLEVDCAHSHVHVCRSPQHLLALLTLLPAASLREPCRRQLQSPLICTHCLVETTLGNPYISQCDCAPDCVSDVPGHLQMSHAIGIRLVRCLEIPAQPGCEPQERCGPSEREVVILRYQVEHPPGVFHGAIQIAQSQGPSGTGNSNRTRETAKRLFVRDDHSSRLSRQGLRCRSRI